MHLLSLTLLLLSEFLPGLKEQSVWQGLGMTSPGIQRGKEDSWRCPDWRGTGLPVVQMYRGDQAHVQHNALACLKRGRVEGWPQFLPNMLVCSLAMVWTASHTQALTVPAQSPATLSRIVLHVCLGTALQVIGVT